LLRQDELGPDAVRAQRDPGPVVEPDDVGVVAAGENLSALGWCRGGQRSDQGRDGRVGVSLADARLGVGVLAHTGTPSFFALVE
jgi:hypothetical protein